MPELAAPEAFLFDLDGTLVDCERENVESVVLALRRYGAEMTDEERGFVIGHSWNEIHAMVVRNHALTVPMGELIAAAVDEKDAILAKSGHRALPGAVDRCGGWRGVPLAVVSGASRNEVRDALSGHRRAGAVPGRRGRRGLRPRQAGARAYLMGLARRGRRRGPALVIEDATPGILSARAAGARVIGVRAGNFAGYDLSPADVVRRHAGRGDRRALRAPRQLTGHIRRSRESVVKSGGCSSTFPPR